MKFNLELNCDNAVFEDPPTEMARILREIASDLERGRWYGDWQPVHDLNWNNVGRFKLE